MKSRTLKEKVTEAISAAFSGIWVRSFEHEDAIREIASACKEFGWVLLMWDPENDLQEPEASKNSTGVGPPNPMAALQKLRSIGLGTGDNRTRGVLVMRNVHPYIFTPDQRIMNPVLLQGIQHTIEKGSTEGLHIIVLSYDSVKLIPELEKMFYMVDHDLPDADELWKLANEVLDVDELPKRDSDEAEVLLNAAAGLTRLEALGAFSMSIARHQSLKPDTLWELKEGMLKKGGLLEMHRPKSGFDALGGLNHVKEFCLQSFGVDAAGNTTGKRSAKARAKGILLLGLPGTGKSAFAKALGYQVGRPTVTLDMGSLFGGVVGQSEENTRRALKTVDAMAPCIMFVDEIEKAFAGAGGGSLDSGVSDRMFGSFLTWLNDHETDVYFIATCNDIRKLAAASSGAFARAERFDALFFMDLPVAEQRDAIWNIYSRDLTPEQTAARPDDNEWTGAEIRACCRLAELFNKSLVEVGEQIVPVSQTSREQIEALKEWAHHRCLSADYKGVYDKNGPKKFMTPDEINAVGNRPRRRVTTRNTR